MGADAWFPVDFYLLDPWYLAVGWLGGDGLVGFKRGRREFKRCHWEILLHGLWNQCGRARYHSKHGCVWQLPLFDIVLGTVLNCCMEEGKTWVLMFCNLSLAYLEAQASSHTWSCYNSTAGAADSHQADVVPTPVYAGWCCSSSSVCFRSYSPSAEFWLSSFSFSRCTQIYFTGQM